MVFVLTSTSILLHSPESRGKELTYGSEAIEPMRRASSDIRPA